MDASGQRMRISLVIPAFNEEESIAQAVIEAETTLPGLFDEFEVLVVDDGSTDLTAQVVECLLPLAQHTRLIRHDINQGYGAALRTGFEAARHDLIAFTDADCQFDLADLGMLARIAGVYPIVAGYRVNRQDHWRRRLFSWGYNRLARTLLGTRVRDVDCALKVFQRDVLGQLLPESRGFFVNTEMMTRARQLGYRVAEHPVSHRARAGGESKVSLGEIPRTAWKLVSFWWSNVLFGPRKNVTPQVFQGRVALPGRAASRVPGPFSDRLPGHRAARPTPHRESA